MNYAFLLSMLQILTNVDFSWRFKQQKTDWCVYVPICTHIYINFEICTSFKIVPITTFF